MLHKPYFLLWLLSLVALEESRAQAAVLPGTAQTRQVERSGTWSAASNSGLTLMGTWTAVPDSASGTVTGTWTLFDGRGNTVARGGWSAAKESREWAGEWRAVASGREGEFRGTWSSTVDLGVKAEFAALFEKAVQTIVSGEWRMGRYAGGWSIRAAPR